MPLKKLLIATSMLGLLAGCAGMPGEEGSAAIEETTAETRYQGTLPCRRCDGIALDVTLTGTPDEPEQAPTFSLSADYLNHPQNPAAETYTGNWQTLNGTPDNDNATVLELTPEDDGQVYLFLQLDPSTLELIDADRRRFENSERLRLNRSDS